MQEPLARGSDGTLPYDAATDSATHIGRRGRRVVFDVTRSDIRSARVGRMHGFGIGLCQVALGRRDGLVAVLPEAIGFDLGVWLVMHKDLKSTRRVRLMFDHLASQLQVYVASGA